MSNPKWSDVVEPTPEEARENIRRLIEAGGSYLDEKYPGLTVQEQGAAFLRDRPAAPENPPEPAIAGTIASDWPLATGRDTPAPAYLHGWVCPRCSRVHAPHVVGCGYCNGAGQMCSSADGERVTVRSSFGMLVSRQIHPDKIFDGLVDERGNIFHRPGGLSDPGKIQGAGC